MLCSEGRQAYMDRQKFNYYYISDEFGAHIALISACTTILPRYGGCSTVIISSYLNLLPSCTWPAAPALSHDFCLLFLSLNTWSLSSWLTWGKFLRMPRRNMGLKRLFPVRSLFHASLFLSLLVCLHRY